MLGDGDCVDSADFQSSFFYTMYFVSLSFSYKKKSRSSHDTLCFDAFNSTSIFVVGSRRGMWKPVASELHFIFVCDLGFEHLVVLATKNTAQNERDLMVERRCASFGRRRTVERNPNAL